MKTVQDILDSSLKAVCNQRPKHEVEQWIAWNLNLEPLDLYLFFDRIIDRNTILSIQKGVPRLAQGEPLAYIIGRKCFYGYEFIVSRDVLIPRPETELLVEEAVKLCQKKKTGTIFDIGTGSGCIGLTVKKLFPSWHCILSDISSKALEIAKKNAEAHNLTVEFLEGSFFQPFKGKKASCIIANPPYLSSLEWQEADRTVRDYEPKTALCSGPLGTESYQALFQDARSYLDPNGVLIVEIGDAEKITQIASQYMFSCRTLNDLSNQPRILIASPEI